MLSPYRLEGFGTNRFSEAEGWGSEVPRVRSENQTSPGGPDGTSKGIAVPEVRSATRSVIATSIRYLAGGRVKSR